MRILRIFALAWMLTGCVASPKPCVAPRSGLLRRVAERGPAPAPVPELIDDVGMPREEPVRQHAVRGRDAVGVEHASPPR